MCVCVCVCVKEIKRERERERERGIWKGTGSGRKARIGRDREQDGKRQTAAAVGKKQVFESAGVCN